MATTITGIGQSKVLSNLDTYTHTVGLNSMYTVEIKVTEQPPSGLTVQIQKNGTPIVTAASPAASQNHIELRTILNCVVSDTISAVLSSSTPGDENINAIRAILKITPGLV
jgi:hypothetical protein